MVTLNETPAQWLQRKGIKPPHLVAKNERKPHLYKQGGVWFCLDGLWLGWAPARNDAYDQWLHRGYSSCVHHRETPLQRRQRERVRWLHAIAVVRAKDV